jgi:hypothetical protein
MLQREAMNIARDEDVPVALARIEDPNPIHSIDLIIETSYIDDSF